MSWHRFSLVSLSGYGVETLGGVESAARVPAQSTRPGDTPLTTVYRTAAALRARWLEEAHQGCLPPGADVQWLAARRVDVEVFAKNGSQGAHPTARYAGLRWRKTGKTVPNCDQSGGSCAKFLQQFANRWKGRQRALDTWQLSQANARGAAPIPKNCGINTVSLLWKPSSSNQLPLDLARSCWSLYTCMAAGHGGADTGA
eukprot:scaffold870_cov268-Pinguiococcus_pyrenoidosus.AAC.44